MSRSKKSVCKSKKKKLKKKTLISSQPNESGGLWKQNTSSSLALSGNAHSVHDPFLKDLRVLLL